ncbi:MAG: hypothetical protein KGN02_10490 [bacterium]|nr:hypothetical protein [bacterium]
MKTSRDAFIGMLIVGFCLGATVLFAVTALASIVLVSAWQPMIAVLPAVLVIALVVASRFWRPDGINRTSGFLLGLGIGLAGACTTCVLILQGLSHTGN